MAPSWLATERGATLDRRDHLQRIGAEQMRTDGPVHLVDQIGGKEGRIEVRPALEQEGSDVALGQAFEHPARVGQLVGAAQQLGAGGRLGHRIPCPYDEDSGLVATEPARVGLHRLRAGDQNSDRIRRHAPSHPSRREVVADTQPDAARPQRPDAASDRVEGGSIQTHEAPVGPAAEALRRALQLGPAVDAGDHVDRHGRPAVGTCWRLEACHRVVQLELERRIRPETVDAMRSLAHRISPGAQKRYCSKRPNGSDEQSSVMNASIR